MNRPNRFIVLDSLSSNAPSPSEDKKPIRKLFINNFRGKIDKSTLRKTFSQYGKIIQFRGPFFSANGYPFAFITYLKPNDALKALEAGRQKEVFYNGKPLRIVPSFQKTQPTENEIKRLVSKKRKAGPKASKKISKDNDSKKETSIDYINQLDDDCLINIFTLLSIKDRMKIERVCKRWQSVGERSWHDIKKLDLSQQLLNSTKRAQKIKNRAIEKIIERCGRFLTSLNFSIVNLGCTAPEVLSVIGEHCPNIAQLTLQLYKYPSKVLIKLFSQLQKIQYLEIKDIGKDFKCDVIGHLSHCSIEEIRLSTKMSYASFEPRLRYLGTSSSGVFHKLNKMHSLTLNGFILKSENIKSIAKNSDLTHLSLANCNVRHNIEKLTSLQKLEHLNLSKVLDVSNTLLVALPRNCTMLKYLNLTECSSVLISGIEALAKLPQLEILIVNGIFQVTDSILSKFVNLHELHCENCDRIGDSGIITLIETAPNLRYLNVYNTMISPAVLGAADALTKIRTNNLTLHLKISTSVSEEWEGVSEPSPLLYIEEKDDNVSDISDEFSYDDEDVEDEFWDLGIDDDFDDEYDDVYGYEFDYNGDNPFYLF